MGQVYWPEDMPHRARMLRLGLLGLFQVKLPPHAAVRRLVPAHGDGTSQASRPSPPRDLQHEYVHSREVDDSGISASAYSVRVAEAKVASPGVMHGCHNVASSRSERDTCATRVHLTRRRTQHNYSRMSVPTATPQDVKLHYKSRHVVDMAGITHRDRHTSPPHLVVQASLVSHVGLPGHTEDMHIHAARHGHRVHGQHSFQPLGPGGSTVLLRGNPDATTSVEAHLRLVMAGEDDETEQDDEEENVERTAPQEEHGDQVVPGGEGAQSDLKRRTQEARLLHGLVSGTLMPDFAPHEVRELARPLKIMGDSESTTDDDWSAGVWRGATDIHTRSPRQTCHSHTRVLQCLLVSSSDALPGFYSNVVHMLECLHDVEDPSQHSPQLIACWSRLRKAVEARPEGYATAIATLLLEHYVGFAEDWALFDAATSEDVVGRNDDEPVPLLNQMQVSSALGVLAAVDSPATQAAFFELLQEAALLYEAAVLQEEGEGTGDRHYHMPAVAHFVSEVMEMLPVLSGEPQPRLLHVVGRIAGVQRDDSWAVDSDIFARGWHSCVLPDHVTSSVRTVFRVILVAFHLGFLFNS